MNKVKCNYCSKEFEVSNKRYNEHIKLNRLFFCNSSCVANYNNDKQFGVKKEFIVKCITCGSDHVVIEREKSFPKKVNYFCTIQCARSYSRSKCVTTTKQAICNGCGIELTVDYRSSKQLCNDCKKRKPSNHKNAFNK